MALRVYVDATSIGTRSHTLDNFVDCTRRTYPSRRTHITLREVYKVLQVRVVPVRVHHALREAKLQQWMQRARKHETAHSTRHLDQEQDEQA